MRAERIRPLMFGLALLASGTLSAEAHPHVWVSARAEIMLGPERQLLGIREAWTFDREFSAFQVLNLDADRDGKPDPDKLTALARERLGPLAEYGYFTQLKVNGAAVSFGTPTDADFVYQDDRLTLSFVLPLAAPMRLRQMSLAFDDRTFFVAFSIASGKDAIRLSDPKAGCALILMRPKAEAEEGKQIIPDDQAAALAAAGQVTAEYTTRIIVACP